MQFYFSFYRAQDWFGKKKNTPENMVELFNECLLQLMAESPPWWTQNGSCSMAALLRVAQHWKHAAWNYRKGNRKCYRGQKLLGWIFIGPCRASNMAANQHWGRLEAASRLGHVLCELRLTGWAASSAAAVLARMIHHTYTGYRQTHEFMILMSD